MRYLKRNFGYLLLGFSVSMLLGGAGVGLMALHPVGQRIYRTAAREAARMVDPMLDVEAAARARLRQATGLRDLPLPLPEARLMVCKENRRIDLFAGERFIRRYRLEEARTLPVGLFHLEFRERPRQPAQLAFGLSAASPAESALAGAARPHSHAGEGEVLLASHEDSPVTATGTVASTAPLALVTGTVPAEPGSFVLAQDDLAELFVAVAPGTLVVVEE